MTKNDDQLVGNESNVWVCTDCFITHHYGAVEHEGLWYPGESDTPMPAGFQPLSELAEHHIFDNTDSNTGEGIKEFSTRQCGGCGSLLHGGRYRLLVEPLETT